MGFSAQPSSLVVMFWWLLGLYLLSIMSFLWSILNFLSSRDDDSLLDVIYNDHFDYSWDSSEGDVFYSFGELIYCSPPLDVVLLDKLDKRLWQDQLHHQKEISEEMEQSKWLHVPAPTSQPGQVDNDNEHFPDLMVVSEMTLTINPSLHHTKWMKSMQHLEILIMKKKIMLSKSVWSLDRDHWKKSLWSLSSMTSTTMSFYDENFRTFMWEPTSI